MAKRLTPDRQDSGEPGGEKATTLRVVGEGKQDPGLAGEGAAETRRPGIWVREDGAVCVDNECVTLEAGPDGALGFTFDPNKCSCEVADQLTDQLIRSITSGKGVKLTMKPKEFKKE